MTDVTELYHSVKESLDCLMLLDIKCSVHIENEENVPSKSLIDVYDRFEEIAESRINTASAVMVLIGAENGEPYMTVNISGNDTSDDGEYYRYPPEGGSDDI